MLVKGSPVIIVSTKNNPMQKVGQEWESIYLYSLARGIVVARLNTMKLGTY